MDAHDPKKFHPSRAASLDAPEREQYLPTPLLIDALELDGGETVLDYGAGTGRLAMAVAAALTRGRVVAVDESAEMVALMQDRLAAVANATVALISANSVPLRDGEADRILAVSLLHEIRGEGALREMRRVIAADGILLLADWERGRPRPAGPSDQILYTAGEAVDELRAAGFEPAEVALGLPYHFVIRATAAPVDAR